MSDTELKLPLRLMSLEALRREEDRLLHELHGIRDRRDAVGHEIMARLAKLEESQTAQAPKQDRSPEDV